MKEKEYYDLINSSIIKDYYTHNNYSLSASDKVALIYNSKKINLDKKIELFKDIRKKYTNIKINIYNKSYLLDDLINNHIESIYYLRDLFLKGDDSIYEVIMYEEDSMWYTSARLKIHKTYTEVINDIKGYKNIKNITFHIKKKYFDNSSKQINVFFNSNLDIVNIDERNIYDNNDDKKTRLYGIKYNLKHPLKKGDLLVYDHVDCFAFSKSIVLIEEVDEDGNVKEIVFNEDSNDFYTNVTHCKNNYEYYKNNPIYKHKILYLLSNYLKGKISLMDTLELYNIINNKINEEQRLEYFKEDKIISEILCKINLN